MIQEMILIKTLLKTIYIRVYKFFLQAAYALASLVRKQDQRKVVIALYRTNLLDGNLKFIHDELMKQLPHAKIHLVHGENRMNLKLFKEIFAIAHASYLILDDYYLPIYLIKPIKKLKIIQLWHAAGAFKKFGYSTIGTKFGPNPDYLKLVPIHSNYTYVYISSSRFAGCYAEAFHMPINSIFALGLPRTDLFNSEYLRSMAIEKIVHDYPILANEVKVNILIAPTYRAKGPQGESTFDFMDEIERLSRLIDSSKRIILKVHPYMNPDVLERLKACPNILVAKAYTINEWMLVSDAFITDYSSAVFEYALLQRPLAHFVPDYDEYKTNRGFYHDIQTISDGDILQSEPQLLEWMNIRERNEFHDTSRMIDVNFDRVDNVSRDIVAHFLSGSGSGDNE